MKKGGRSTGGRSSIEFVATVRLVQYNVSDDGELRNDVVVGSGQPQFVHKGSLVCGTFRAWNLLRLSSDEFAQI